jgi:hypothetical protein
VSEATKPPPPPRPSKRSARPSKAQIRQLYMASKHVEWTPFAKTMGWGSLDHRRGLPVDEWIAEKREIIAREQAETISEMVFHHRSTWHTDVLKTLESFPRSFDAMSNILNARLNDIIATINDDQKDKATAAARGEVHRPRFRDVKTSELVSLAAALKIVTEGKHKSLLIGDWSFKVAETFSDPRQFQQANERLQNREWTVEIIGADKMGHQKVEELLGNYYDQPPMPHTPDEVAALPKAVGDGDD